jgi:hypothetical protein
MLIAAILALLSLIGLILTFTSGLLTAGVDGIFMILVCLITLAVFGGIALSLGVQGGYIPVPARFRHNHK